MGRLTRDPELRYTQSQIAVASFTVACERDYAAGGGDRETDFIDCVAWRGTGEFVHKYFHKGSMIVVSGRLQSRRWTDRDDNKRTSWEILADSCYFGESKRENDGGNYGQQSGSYQRQSQQSGNYGHGGSYQQQSRSPERAADVSAQDFRELDDSDGELPF
jgi:single-strand DNA-binding protein